MTTLRASERARAMNVQQMTTMSSFRNPATQMVRLADRFFAGVPVHRLLKPRFENTLQQIYRCWLTFECGLSTFEYSERSENRPSVL